ncbi:MAG: type 1 glutamine amidotransferase domain-containing protein [Chthoniobacteraceae bacterium]
MNHPLLNKRVAILATNGFEQSELEGPLKALKEAGATVSIVSPAKEKIQGMRHSDKGDFFDVDIPLANAKPEEFDARVLPGGLMNPDELRSTPAAVDFVRAFGEAGKPIGAICHGPWVLIEAGLIENRRVTSWPAIKTDIENAGGLWVDEEVVVDSGLVTSARLLLNRRALDANVATEFLHIATASRTPCRFTTSSSPTRSKAPSSCCSIKSSPRSPRRSAKWTSGARSRKTGARKFSVSFRRR